MTVQALRRARTRGRSRRLSALAGEPTSRPLVDRDYRVAHRDGFRVCGPALLRPGVVAGVAALALATLCAPAGSTAGATTTRGVAALVPGIVDVNTSLPYEDAVGAGTGIVLTGSGEVLTNNHVIQGATTVRVTDIDNGHIYTATVVGYDISADIALLQLKNASGLKTAPLGNSKTAKVGDKITSIGNAGGVGGTPSSVSGSITRLNQSITASDEMNGGSERLTGLIETNAVLEPGDSGGPMVNSNDQVIGIDTAGGSQGFTFQARAGEGFAIPIGTATAVARRIEAGDASKAVHVGATPFLGLDVEQVSYYQQMQSAPGLLVVAVVTGSPVEKAGLAPGDVITSLDGQATSSGTRLTSLLLNHKPGEAVRLGWVDQNGTAHTSTIHLASGPPQ